MGKKVGLGYRLYRTVLRVFPRSFRAMHGADMAEAVADMAADARRDGGSAEVYAFWTREILLLVANAFRVWARTLLTPSTGPHGLPRPRLGDRNMLGSLMQDVRYAFRTIARAPGFAAVVVFTLAIGIGGNTAIFSVVHGVLLRPMPYPAPHQLVFIWDGLDWIDIPRAWVVPAEVADLRERTTAFQGLAAIDPLSISIVGDGAPELLRGAQTTDNLFRLLGAVPAVGRLFVDGDDDPGSPSVAVLSYPFWERRFGADRGIVGRNINLAGQETTVVGVLPEDFRFLVHSSLGEPQDPDVWLPLQVDLAAVPRGSHYLAVLGRIRDGVTFEQAQQDLATVSRGVDAEYYRGNGFQFRAVPLHADLVDDVRPALLVLLGAVGLVLLIVVTNIATLMLARSQRRGREFAIRAAVGAGRTRLMSQLVVESLVLAGLGGLLGFLAAAWGVDFLVRLAPSGLPRAAEIGIDPVVLVFTIVVSVVAGVACGIAPAAFANRRDTASRLRDGGRANTHGGSVHRFRGAMIVTEFALSLMLLVGTGLLIRTFAIVQRADPGFDSAGVLTMRVTLPSSDYPEATPRIDFFSRLIDQVRGLPGVTAVGAVSALPLSASSNQTIAFSAEDGFDPTSVRDDDGVFLDRMIATPGYFAAAGITLVDGRVFTSGDRADAEQRIIVDESLATAFWPDDPQVLGRQVWVAGASRTVVGVVRHARMYRVHEDDRPQLYQPHPQVPTRALSLTVRTSSDPLLLAGPVRELVWSLDPNQPVSDVVTLDEIVGTSLAERRFTLLLMVAFGGIALVLAALGLYGVMAYTVTQRVHELGLRMALGATGDRVLGLIFKQAGVLVGVGLIGGLLGSLAMARLLSSMVFGVSTRDPITLSGVAVLLAGVAAVASYLPARRASRLDPMVALRSE